MQGRGFERYTTEQVLLHIPKVFEEADAGETWTAVRYALWVGLMQGLGQGVHDRVSVERLKDMEPDAQWARQLRQRFRDAGEGTRKHRPEDICDRVQRMHEQWPSLSWTRVCERVGENLHPPLSRRAVQNHAGDADWRPPKKSGKRP